MKGSTPQSIWWLAEVCLSQCVDPGINLPGQIGLIGRYTVRRLTTYLS
jgi:hypothetical protein